MKVTDDYNLEKLCPEIAKEWHPTKNGELKPNQVTPASTKKVWWKCIEGHEWQTSMHTRSKGSNCPKCSRNKMSIRGRILGRKRAKSMWGNNYLLKYSFGKQYPEFAKEWHPTKNGNLKPTDVTISDERKVWWIDGLAHKWQATVHSRSRRFKSKQKSKGCPSCARSGSRFLHLEYRLKKEKSFKEKFNKIANEWNYEKNDKKPEEYLPVSHQKVWWKCKKGHEYKMQIYRKTGKQKQGCPHPDCRYTKTAETRRRYTIKKHGGSFADKFSHLLREWNWEKNGNLNPNKLPYTSEVKIWWNCKRKHEWKTAISKRTIRQQNCPKCNNKTSHLEVRVYSELKYFFPRTIWQHPFKNGHLDVFIPGHNIAIEIDGFWHQGREDRDLLKDREAKKLNIKMIRIRWEKLEKISKLHISHNWQSRKGDFSTFVNLIKILLLEMKLDNQKRTKLLEYIENEKYVNETFFLDTWANNTDPKPGHSLAERFPEVAKDWHPTANGNLTPNDIPYSSQMSVYWLCKVHGKWQQSPNGRTNNNPPSGCKKCGDKRRGKARMIMAAEKHSVKDIPQLIKQWHPTKNTEFTPEMVSPGSSKVVWWKCKEGHEWKARIGVIYKHLNEATKLDIFSGCPDCYKNNREEFANEIRKIKLRKKGSVLVHYPSISKIWAKDNEWKPSELSNGSRYPVRLICPNKHIVKRALEKIISRLSKNGDIYCNKCNSHFGLN